MTDGELVFEVQEQSKPADLLLLGNDKRPPQRGVK
jgi:hypothetical protein